MQFHPTNNDSHSFLRLHPYGRGFEMPGMPWLLPTDTKEEYSDTLDSCREEFLQLCGYDRARNNVQHVRLICKTKFILDHENNLLSRDVLLALLAEQNLFFSSEYQIYASDHKFYTHKRNVYGKFPSNQRRYCREEALRHCGERKERYESVLNMLIEKGAKESKSVRVYQDILMRQDSEKQVLQVLRQWDSKIQLTEEEVSKFAYNVLPRYCQCLRMQEQVKTASGHYRVPMNQLQPNVQEYCTRRQYLQQLVDAGETGQVQRDLFSFRSESILGSKRAADTYEELYKATADYFDHVKNSGNMIRKEAVRDVAESFQAGSGGLFPFRYLVACIVEGRRMFMPSYASDHTSFEKFSEHIYREKPSIPSQRIARMKLLNKLCCICDLSEEDKRRNWDAFFQYHGLNWRSEEECTLVREALKSLLAGQPCTMPKYFSQEAFCVQAMLLQTACVPVDYGTLFCYVSASPLHLDGFAKVIKRYPCSLKQCVYRIEQNLVKWDNALKMYLAYWAAEKIDLKGIHSLVSQNTSNRQWARIPHVSSKEIINICPVNAKPSEYEKELKALLVESAMRSILTKKAAKVLCNQLEKTFFSNFFPKENRMLM